MENYLLELYPPYVTSFQACEILGITYAQFRYLRRNEEVIETLWPTARQRTMYKLPPKGQVFRIEDVLKLRDILAVPTPYKRR